MSDFFIFAGPNGSGKSTIISTFLQDIDVIYLNADYCSRADSSIAMMPDGPEKSHRAQKVTEDQIRKTISEGRSLAWETVFSHESRFRIMEYAKKNGYSIHLIYITTIDPDINVERVRTRVRAGGHDVPEKKIRARYKRSVSFLPQMILTADEVIIYDNSTNYHDPTLLFQKFLPDDEDSEPRMITWEVDDEKITSWIIEHITNPLERLGFLVPCYRII